MTKDSIIVPIYNEKKTFATIIIIAILMFKN